MSYLFLYASFLKRFVKSKPLIKVVFDCSNGAVGLILRKLFPQAIFVNDKPDGNFPGHGPNPMLKRAMDDLKRAVEKTGADLGAIFDADGDRVFFVDDKGIKLESDVIAHLLIWFLKPKKILVNEIISWLMEKSLNRPILVSRTGHYFMKKMMRQEKADFGAEHSGHFYFKNFFYAESGILTVIQVINAVSRLPYKLSDFRSLLPQFFRSGEINFKIQKNLQSLLERTEAGYKNSAEKISHLDGLSMDLGDGWFNLRPSGNEPLIRLNAAAKSRQRLEEILRNLNILIRK